MQLFSYINSGLTAVILKRYPMAAYWDIHLGKMIIVDDRLETVAKLSMQEVNEMANMAEAGALR